MQAQMRDMKKMEVQRRTDESVARDREEGRWVFLR